MATALSAGEANPERIVGAFSRYMSEGGHRMTRAVFEENLVFKLKDKRFLSDIPPLLAAGQNWDAQAAGMNVMDALCPLLEGDPWSKR